MQKYIDHSRRWWARNHSPSQIPYRAPQGDVSVNQDRRQASLADFGLLTVFGIGRTTTTTDALVPVTSNVALVSSGIKLLHAAPDRLIQQGSGSNCDRLAEADESHGRAPRMALRETRTRAIVSMSPEPPYTIRSHIRIFPTRATWIWGQR